MTDTDDLLRDLPEGNKQLRASIEDRHLKLDLLSLWKNAIPLQDSQKGTTDQGHNHCLTVERYVWHLIGHFKNKFKDEDLFILSAAAALHDIAKIQEDEKKEKDPAWDHGLAAKEKLLETDFGGKLIADKGLREAVAQVISAHNNGKIDDLPKGEFVVRGSSGVFLRSLAAIFRLADMLHSDYTRCDYLVLSFKKLAFAEEIRTWAARSSIRGPRTISPGDEAIILQASPTNKKEEIAALAEVDSLNDSLTPSQKENLENCPVQYLENGIVRQDTMHFPCRFLLEIDGKKREGLASFYTNFALRYTSGVTNLLSNVNLTGIGEFSEIQSPQLMSIFIDTRVTLYSGSLAPTSWEKIGERDAFREQISKSITDTMQLPTLKRIVLLGDPGSGKTTISQYLLLKRADSFSKDSMIDSKLSKQKGIPFRVILRDLVSEKERTSDIDLNGLLSHIVKAVRTFAGDQEVPLGFAESWLSREGSLVILDGYDEIVNPIDRRHVRDAITNLAEKFPQVKILVSSRIVGYDEVPFDRNLFLHLFIKEVTKEQVKAFVRNWHESRLEDPKQREDMIDGFYKALEEPRVLELAGNPLLLTIMVLVHKGKGDLPKQRALLYKQCVDAFLESRVKMKRLPISYDENEVRAFHEFLGYWMHQRAETYESSRAKFSGVTSIELRTNLKDYIVSSGLSSDEPEREQKLALERDATKKVDEFLEAAKRHVGLIVESGNDVWKFGHGSFQEYFAARYIVRKTSGLEEIWSMAKGYIGKPHWQEPLKLLAGIYGIEQPRTLDLFVRRILQEYEKVGDKSYAGLVLAGEIAGEVALMKDPTSQIRKKLVYQLLNSEDPFVFDHCKRVLNNLYYTAYWKVTVDEIRERAHVMQINRMAFARSAFHSFLAARQFGDTRIDRILATLV